MQFTFTDVSPATVKHWRNFSIQHLYDSDRLTRNLYDLRQLSDVSDDAVKYAIELNNDPSVRNIRLAVVATHEKVREALKEVATLTTPGGVEMGLFTTIEEAEAWLDRPLTLLV